MAAIDDFNHSPCLPKGSNDAPLRVVVLIVCDLSPICAQFKRVLRCNENHPAVDVRYVYGSSPPSEVLPCDLVMPTVESLVPGIFRKTILAAEKLLADTSWTHLLRTNMSSLFFWERVHAELERLPRTGLVFANHVVGDISNTLSPYDVRSCRDQPPRSFPSGCGTFMSHDVVASVVAEARRFWIVPEPDDVVLGRILAEIQVPVVNYNWWTYSGRIEPGQFHFRFKSANRSRDVAAMQRALEAMYVLRTG